MITVCVGSRVSALKTSNVYGAVYAEGFMMQKQMEIQESMFLEY